MIRSWMRPETRKTARVAAVALSGLRRGVKTQVCARSRKPRFQGVPQNSPRVRCARGRGSSAGCGRRPARRRRGGRRDRSGGGGSSRSDRANRQAADARRDGGGDGEEEEEAGESAGGGGEGVGEGARCGGTPVSAGVHAGPGEEIGKASPPPTGVVKRHHPCGEFAAEEKGEGKRGLEPTTTRITIWRSTN